MNSSISITLPWLTNSTNSVMRNPRPVSVMAPTMMPAVAVAMPMPIMLRAPSLKPCTTESQPCGQAPGVFTPRKKSIKGRCVSISTISAVTAQKAESAGDISSTIRHQISTPMGMMKCSPARTVGQVSSGLGLLTSMSSGRSGLRAASRSAYRYIASSVPPTAQGAAAPSVLLKNCNK